MKRMLLLMGLSALCMLGLNAQSATIAGKWKGFVTQEGVASSLSSSYGLQVECTQQGGYLKGTARFNTNEAWVTFNMVGAVLGNSVSFHDVNVITDYLGGKGSWCIKYLMLTYDPQRGVLSGQWFSENCGTGMVEISRVK